jgi:cobalt-zinc-cadmium efflux system outer membrane protein
MPSRRFAVPEWLVLLPLLAGCEAGPAKEAWPEPLPLGRDLPAFKPPADEAPREAPREPEGDLTLGQAVALALLQSPDLAASGWEVRAREARVLQAGLLPNPSLGATVENLGTSKDEVTGGIQTTIQLGQLVELGGKRSARIRAAAAERDVAGWDYELRRIDVLSRLSLRFIEVLHAQRSLELHSETAALAEQARLAVAEKVAGGKASPVDETKAAVAAAAARIALDRARLHLEGSRRSLSAAWGGSTPRFRNAAGDLDAVVPVPPLERLAGLLARNPEWALRASEIAMREAAVDLALARAVPDLQLNAGYRRYSPSGEDVDTLLVGVSIPLPVFDRGQGEIREARSRVARSREERREAELRLGLALADAHRALSGAQAELAALRQTVLPGAQRAFEAVREGYQLGRFGLLDVLDSQRTLSEARGQALRTAMEYHKAVVDVERLIGDRLDSVK